MDKTRSVITKPKVHSGALRDGWSVYGITKVTWFRDSEKEIKTIYVI